MKGLKKLTVSLILLFNSFATYAQLPNDKDVVTLKNGQEYIGYVFEQVPGSNLKMIRLFEKDTLSIPMDEVVKYSKLFATKSAIRRDLRKANNPIDTSKKHVIRSFLVDQDIHIQGYFSLIHLTSGAFDLFGNFDSEPIQGIGLSIVKGINLKYRVGLSANYHVKQRSDPGSLYYGYTDAIATAVYDNLSVFVEGKYLLLQSKAKRKVNIFGGLGIGYSSHTPFTNYTDWTVSGLGSRREYVYEDAVTIEASIQIIISPFKHRQQGFTIEPVWSFYNPTINVYDDRLYFVSNKLTLERYPESLPDSFKGKYQLLSLRMGYSF